MNPSLSTGARLTAAAALCLVPLHSAAPGPRALLVLAAFALLWCATRPRTSATRQLARVATVGVGLAAALAASRGAAVPLVGAVGALILAGPPVWRRPAASVERPE